VRDWVKASFLQDSQPGKINAALHGDVPSLEPLARLILDHLEWPDIIIIPRVGVLLLVGGERTGGAREQERQA